MTKFHKLPWIDNVKALAIFLVICYHSQVIQSPISWSILSICVPLFFCVNGYLMLRREYSIREIWKKNLKLLILILFWGIVSSFSGMIYHNESISIKDVFLHFWKFDSDYGNHLWFLCTLFILNAFNPFVYTIFNRTEQKWGGYFFILLIVFTVEGISRLTWKFNPFTGWKGFALLFYILGYYVFSNSYNINNWSKKRLLLLLGLSLLIQSGLNYSLFHFPIIRNLLGVNTDIVFNQYNSIFVLIATVCVFIIISRISSTNKFISYIGQHSLAIYLLQDVSWKLVKNYAPNVYLINNYPGKYLVPPLILLLSVFLTVLFNSNKYSRYLISV